MLKPLHDRVVVKALPDEATSIGGIILPQNANQQTHRGQVLAVGPGKSESATALPSMSVAVGDMVLFSRYVGQVTNDEGVECHIMREEDILAVVG